MILLNVIYVSDFLINIVAESILEDKELHFDTQHRHLHRNGSPIILVPKISAHYVLKDNREPEGVFATFIRAGYTHDEHKLSALAATAAEGVDKDPAPSSKGASKAAPTSKPAWPLAPPTTPPKTCTAVISKPAAKSASMTSPPQTPIQPRKKRIQRSCLTLEDLYRSVSLQETPSPNAHYLVF